MEMLLRKVAELLIFNKGWLKMLDISCLLLTSYFQSPPERWTSRKPLKSVFCFVHLSVSPLQHFTTVCNICRYYKDICAICADAISTWKVNLFNRAYEICILFSALCHSVTTFYDCITFTGIARSCSSVLYLILLRCFEKVRL